MLFPQHHIDEVLAQTGRDLERFDLEHGPFASHVSQIRWEVRLAVCVRLHEMHAARSQVLQLFIVSGVEGGVESG